jgi:hypothetical protein
MNFKNETITLDKSQYVEIDFKQNDLKDVLDKGMEVIF